MKVLVLGSGGKEHAIAWKLSQSRHVNKIYCAPGNAGIAEIAECIDVLPVDFNTLVDFVKYEWIDLTIVDTPDLLSQGKVDAFQREGCSIFGPLTLAQDAGVRAEMRMAFAEQRLEEIKVLIAEGRFKEVGPAVLAFETNINQAILELEMVSQVDPARAARLALEITAALTRYAQALSVMAASAPASVQIDVTRALDTTHIVGSLEMPASTSVDNSNSDDGNANEDSADDNANTSDDDGNSNGDDDDANSNDDDGNSNDDDDDADEDENSNCNENNSDCDDDGNSNREDDDNSNGDGDDNSNCDDDDNSNGDDDDNSNGDDDDSGSGDDGDDDSGSGSP